MEKIVPIGKGEQISLEKHLGTLGNTVEELKEAVVRVGIVRDEIIKAHATEMTKPEWARRTTVLQKLEAELAENDAELDKLSGANADLKVVADYIERRHTELDKRKNEEGY